ncbi:hypothetical protein Nmel_010317 [Mimus melanotis]
MAIRPFSGPAGAEGPVWPPGSSWRRQHRTSPGSTPMSSST